MLSRYGEVRTTRPGDVLFAIGDVDWDPVVVLEGSVMVVIGAGANARELVVQRPGDLMAELSAFTGQASEAEGIVRDAGAVLTIPASEFRALVGRELEFGDFVLQTLFRRRQALERLQFGVRIVGSRFDRDTHRLREFAVRNRLLYEWVDVDDARARAWLEELGIAGQGPVVLLAGRQRFLVNPSNSEFADGIGLQQRLAGDARTFDLVVVGGGPGGLAASVYGAAGGMSTCLLDAVAMGGQAATSGRIENYLGFPTGISGAELADRAVLQAEKFGVNMMVPCRAVALAERDGFHVVTVEGGEELLAGSVILALGVQHRELPVPGLADYEGAGVSYAVDVSRAELRPGDAAIVVGGANSAGQAALTLSEEGHHVYLVARGPLEAGMARYLRDRIARDRAIEVLAGYEVRAVGGDSSLEHATVQDTSSGERRTLHVRAMVILVGSQPRTEWLAGEVALDDEGFILTGPQLGSGLGQREPWRTLAREPFLVETSRPGIFAVGDVRSGSTKMVAPAAGDGGMATRFAAQHLARTSAR